MVSKALIATLVGLLTPASVDEVYSGKPGCGCGCRGIYRSHGRLVTSNIRYLQLATQKPDHAVKLSPGGTSDQPGLKHVERVCFSLELERYRWIYITVPVFMGLLDQIGLGGGELGAEAADLAENKGKLE